jgi:hypothetical protein
MMATKGNHGTKISHRVLIVLFDVLFEIFESAGPDNARVHLAAQAHWKQFIIYVTISNQ